MAQLLIEAEQSPAAARVLRLGRITTALEQTNARGRLHNVRLLDYAYRTAYCAARVGELEIAKAAVSVAGHEEGQLRAALNPQVFANLATGWGTSTQEAILRSQLGTDLYSGGAWLLRGLADGHHFESFDIEQPAWRLSVRQELEVTAAETIAVSMARDKTRAGRASRGLLEVLQRHRAEIPPQAIPKVSALLLSSVKALAEASYFTDARALSDEYIRMETAGCASDLAIANAANSADELRPWLTSSLDRPLDPDCRSHLAAALEALSVDEGKTSETAAITSEHDRACLATARAHSLARTRQLERARLMVAPLSVERKLDVYIAILFHGQTPGQPGMSPNSPERLSLLSPPKCTY